MLITTIRTKNNNTKKLIYTRIIKILSISLYEENKVEAIHRRIQVFCTLLIPILQEEHKYRVYR